MVARLKITAEDGDRYDDAGVTAFCCGGALTAVGRHRLRMKTRFESTLMGERSESCRDGVEFDGNGFGRPPR